MNLDETDPKPNEKTKKMSRKEKKAQKKAARQEKQSAQKTSRPDPKPDTPHANAPGASQPEEAAVELEPAPVSTIPPPKYTLWEKISPAARRKRQIANMDNGFREILGLVRSMRRNQDVLMDAYQKLPEAVDSVKKLADHSAQQSELLQTMNRNMESGSPEKFTDTLTSMDKTTQLLLERAQRSEERLYGMLRRAQKRIALMTLLVFLLFLGAVGGVLLVIYPNQTRAWFAGDTPETSEAAEAPEAQEKSAARVDPAARPAPTPTTLPDPTPTSAPSEASAPVEPVEFEVVVNAPVVEVPLPAPPPENAEEIILPVETPPETGNEASIPSEVEDEDGTAEEEDEPAPDEAPGPEEASERE